MFCSRIVCYAALGIRYASDDDVVISSWFHRDVFHQAEISAKGLGRFFFMFMAPLSSSLFADRK